MKLGIISDIHGNIYALKKVLSSFDNNQVDKIIIVGDLIGIGPCPNEVVELINEIKDKTIIVKGNHEDYLINGLPEIVHGNRKMTQIEKDNHNWTKDQLNPESIKFIKTLKNKILLEINNIKIMIEHYPTDENNNKLQFIKKPTLEEYQLLYKDSNHDIYISGHTHKANYYKEQKLYINSGSLGTFNKNNKGDYGILDIQEKNITYTQCELDYDTSKLINKINELQYPMYQDILRIFYNKN